jgi:ferredoxin
MDEQGGATKTWRVAIGPGGPAFEAPEDQTLLRAAEAAGRPLPSSCRNGTCRTCMQRMLSGAVRYRIEWPGLLEEEKREGWVLPCVAHPAADIVLA